MMSSSLTAESLGEIAPQLRMRALRIFLFRKVFEDDRLERNFGAARQYAQMLRESFHVTIVLRRIQLQRFARKFAGLPILVERDALVDFCRRWRCRSFQEAERWT